MATPETLSTPGWRAMRHLLRSRHTNSMRRTFIVVVALLCVLGLSAPVHAVATVTDMAVSRTANDGVEGGRLTITWTQPANATLAHVVATDDGGRTWMAVAYDLKVGAGAASTTFNVDPARTYEVAVRAYSTGHSGGWSGRTRSPGVAGLQAAGTGNVHNTPSGKVCTVPGPSCMGGFRTGSHANGYTVSAVKILFAQTTASPPDVDIVQGNSETYPDPVEGTAMPLTPATAGPASGGWHLFTCTGNCDLDANTHYFVELSLSGWGTYEWRLTDDTSEYRWPAPGFCPYGFNCPANVSDDGWKVRNAHWTAYHYSPTDNYRSYYRHRKSVPIFEVSTVPKSE